jgi:hypothetical protein
MQMPHFQPHLQHLLDLQPLEWLKQPVPLVRKHKERQPFSVVHGTSPNSNRNNRTSIGTNGDSNVSYD